MDISKQLSCPAGNDEKDVRDRMFYFAVNWVLPFDWTIRDIVDDFVEGDVVNGRA